MGSAVCLTQFRTFLSSFCTAVFTKVSHLLRRAGKASTPNLEEYFSFSLELRVLRIQYQHQRGAWITNLKERRKIQFRSAIKNKPELFHTRAANYFFNSSGCLLTAEGSLSSRSFANSINSIFREIILPKWSSSEWKCYICNHRRSPFNKLDFTGAVLAALPGKWRWTNREK